MARLILCAGCNWIGQANRVAQRFIGKTWLLLPNHLSRYSDSACLTLPGILYLAAVPPARADDDDSGTWSHHEKMDDDRKAFYEYHACLMEPWDGPAAIAFTDGRQVGAVLDRNGLRPSRYYVTKDERVILASGVGVLDIPPALVAYKGRLQPGRMLLVDTEQGRIVSDEELKNAVVKAHPYRRWLQDKQIQLAELPKSAAKCLPSGSNCAIPKGLGYTFEDLRFMLGPMAKMG